MPDYEEYVDEFYGTLAERTARKDRHIFPDKHIVKMLKSNVDNERLSDAEFRRLMRSMVT